MNKTDAILNETKRVIVGKDDVLEKVLMAILAKGNILLEDVPGVGKTQLALAFSKSMGMTQKRVQFTPDTMASDIVGFSIYNKSTGKFEFNKGAVFCNFFLGDEINRTSAKTQSALLEAMEELKVTVDGKTYDLPQPFVCIATQNPIGSAGTHHLPDSQLDRFMVKLQMGYPSLADQVAIVKQREDSNPIEKVKKVVNTDEVIEMQKEVSACNISDEIIKYAAELCEKTRSVSEIDQGVSPRAVLALVKMSKANAYMSGRDYVVPQDVSNVFTDVCAHRLILSPKAKIKNVTPDELLKSILESTPMPNPGSKANIKKLKK